MSTWEARPQSPRPPNALSWRTTLSHDRRFGWATVQRYAEEQRHAADLTRDDPHNDGEQLCQMRLRAQTRQLTLRPGRRWSTEHVPFSPRTTRSLSTQADYDQLRQMTRGELTVAQASAWMYAMRSIDSESGYMGTMVYEMLMMCDTQATTARTQVDKMQDVDFMVDVMTHAPDRCAARCAEVFALDAVKLADHLEHMVVGMAVFSNETLNASTRHARTCSRYRAVSTARFWASVDARREFDEDGTESTFAMLKEQVDGTTEVVLPATYMCYDWESLGVSEPMARCCECNTKCLRPTQCACGAAVFCCQECLLREETHQCEQYMERAVAIVDRLHAADYVGVFVMHHAPLTLMPVHVFAGLNAPGLPVVLPLSLEDQAFVYANHELVVDCIAHRTGCVVSPQPMVGGNVYAVPCDARCPRGGWKARCQFVEQQWSNTPTAPRSRVRPCGVARHRGTRSMLSSAAAATAPTPATPATPDSDSTSAPESDGDHEYTHDPPGFATAS